MITRPTTDRLIDVVRQELRDNLCPRFQDDGAVLTSLQMIDHVLETVARRAGHEIAWMIEEIDQLQALGEEVVGAIGPDSRTGAAVAAVAAVDATSLHLDDVSHRYSLASEILACAVEELPPDSPLHATAQAALDRRLEREMSIIGEFQLVGRS
jgi:hypothetical protein